jgi:hypothetical protein
VTGTAELARLSDGVPVVHVFANWGRWVAPCAGCPSALQVVAGVVDEDAGVLGWDAGHRRHGLRCLECGSLHVASWPDEDLTAGVERLLMLRPDPTTRSWYPGETLDDLAAENMAHGVFARLEIDPTPGTASLVIRDGRIVVDALPAPRQQRPLTEIERRELMG